MNQFTTDRNIRTAVAVGEIPAILKCFICGHDVPPSNHRNSITIFRRKPEAVCLSCKMRYVDALEQVHHFGRRYRFVETTEITRPLHVKQTIGYSFNGYRAYRQIYKVLLLLKEREEKRKKEVNWMVDEMTTKILKLPDRLAKIVAKTYAVSGDDFKLGDDEALIRIRDLLEAIDPEIINRNKNKRLS